MSTISTPSTLWVGENKAGGESEEEEEEGHDSTEDNLQLRRSSRVTGLYSRAVTFFDLFIAVWILQFELGYLAMK